MKFCTQVRSASCSSLYIPLWIWMWYLTKTVIMPFGHSLVIVDLSNAGSGREEIWKLWTTACRDDLISVNQKIDVSITTIFRIIYHLIIGYKGNPQIVCSCCVAVANTRYHYFSCHIYLHPLFCSPKASLVAWVPHGRKEISFKIPWASSAYQSHGLGL